MKIIDKYFTPHQLASKEKTQINIVCLLAILSGCTEIFFASEISAFFLDRYKLSFVTIDRIDNIGIFCFCIGQFLSGLISDVLNDRIKIILFGFILNACVKFLLFIDVSLSVTQYCDYLSRFCVGVVLSPLLALFSLTFNKNIVDKTYNLYNMLRKIGGFVFGVAIFIAMFKKISYDFFFLFLVIVNIVQVFLLLILKKTKKNAVLLNEIESVNEKKIINIFKMEKNFWYYLLGVCILIASNFSLCSFEIEAFEDHLKQYLSPVLVLSANLFGFITLFFIKNKVSNTNYNLLKLFANSILFFIAASALSFAIKSFSIDKYMFFIVFILLGIYISLQLSLTYILIDRFSLRSQKATAFAVFYLISAVFYLIAQEIADLFKNFKYGISIQQISFALLAFVYFIFFSKKINKNC